MVPSMNNECYGRNAYDRLEHSSCLNQLFDRKLPVTASLLIGSDFVMTIICCTNMISVWAGFCV